LAKDLGAKVNQKILTMIVDHVFTWIKGPEILEMGFGHGIWTQKIVDKFGHSNICEASPSLIKKARQRYGKKIELYESLFEEFVPQKKYNTIIASFILEHVKDPVDLLKRMSSWLKSDGQIIVIVPNADSFHRRLAVCMGIQKTTDELGQTDRLIGHRRVYTLKKIEENITLAGLKIKRKKGLFIKFLPQSMMKNLSDQILKGYMKLSENMPIEYTATLVFDCRSS
jgi:trans-aconitate methyltransferase